MHLSLLVFGFPHFSLDLFEMREDAVITFLVWNHDLSVSQLLMAFFCRQRKGLPSQFVTTERGPLPAINSNRCHDQYCVVVDETFTENFQQ